jgi:hypothetical protein
MELMLRTAIGSTTMVDAEVRARCGSELWVLYWRGAGKHGRRVSDTDKPPPDAPTVRTDQHAHGRDSTHHASGIFARTPEHQSVGASGSAD